MIKRLPSFFIFIFLFLTLGCGSDSLQSSGEQKSSLSQYTQPATYYGIYYQPNDLSLPPYKVADFDKLTSTGTLPNNLIKNEFGNRTSSTTVQPVNYFIRSIKLNSQFENGDYFFEAPILSEKYELNNGATALTQILKYGFSQPVSLSRVRWEEILLQMELAIGKIQTLNTSEIIEEILTNSYLLSSIQSLVLSQNPGVTLKDYSPPEFNLVWTNPPLAPNEKTKSIKQLINEDAEAFLWLAFWSPRNSTRRTLPDSWSHLKNDTTTVTAGPQETYVYKFDFNSQGEHIISALKTIDQVVTKYDFPFEVMNENIVPEWAQNLQLTFIENHSNKINLEQLSAGLPGATDPDGGVLIYDIVHDSNVPEGMVVEKISGIYYLSWQPDGNDAELVRSGKINLVVHDSDGASVALGIPYTVISDSLPKILNIPASWTLTEGIQNNIIIETSDIDSDPVLPECHLVPISALLTPGLPSGAGFFTYTEEPGSSPGHQVFKVSLIPSFLETIGEDKSASIQCSVNYNSIDLVHLTDNDAHTVEITIINADDPPVWTLGASFINPFVTENQAFTGLAIGSVLDPNPNSTAMAYSVIPVNSISGCQWDAEHGGIITVTETIVGDHSELTLAGTPIFASAENCDFVIEAKDANGLATQSSIFTLSTIDTNRPPYMTAAPAPVLSYSVDEGKPLLFAASTFFTDDDLVEADPRETLIYSCNECASITELTFNSGSGSFSWTPDATRSNASPYNFTINVTDKAGAVASTTVTVTVNDAPSPAILNLSEISVQRNELSGAYGIALTITAASAAIIDAFNYNLIADGNCRAGLITNASGVTGGTTSSTGEVINFILNPDRTTDGNSPLPGTKKTCLMTFTVTKNDDSTITSSINLSIEITNVNRIPNLVIIKGDSNTTTYNLNLTAAPSDYSGQWIKIHKAAVGVNDSDANEDPNVDSFNYVSTLGTISSNNWSFKLPNCLIYESSKTATINKTITVDDGRGGSKTRSVKITVTNARNLGGASCQ